MEILIKITSSNGEEKIIAASPENIINISPGDKIEILNVDQSISQIQVDNSDIVLDISGWGTLTFQSFNSYLATEQPASLNFAYTNGGSLSLQTEADVENLIASGSSENSPDPIPSQTSKFLKARLLLYRYRGASR